MKDELPAYTAAELAERLHGRLDGPGDLRVGGVAALNAAEANQITFIADATHAAQWSRLAAGAAVVTEGLEVPGHAADRRALIFVADAELAIIELLRLWAPAPPLPEVGVHPSAFVHPSAGMGKGVRIGPHVSVGERVTLGEKVVLHAGVRIYPDVSIGEGSVLHANCVVRERCTIGRRCILHQNVSIGADGFGYRPAPDGSGLVKVPQIGTVEIHDEVEIGANTCVDRAKFGSTMIETGAKIDNLCQIAHNCRVGRGTVIAGMTGLAGSVTVGSGVQIGGNVSIVDHVTVGDGARIGGKSGVTQDIPAGESWVGLPASEGREALRQIAAVRRLPDYMRLLTRLQKAAER